jgi:hypothetical protein
MKSMARSVGVRVSVLAMVSVSDMVASLAEVLASERGGGTSFWLGQPIMVIKAGNNAE